jgi:adenosylcobinamide-GDP ribazoletransferase
VRAVLAVVVALLVSWAVRAHAVRRLGGITGDVLGALCEIAVLVSLLVSAAGNP